MNTERKGGFGISTDSSGIFGTPKEWKQLWGHAISNERFLGFEVIGWRWVEWLLNEAKHHGCNVVGIHGRTGGLHDSYNIGHRLTLGALNRIIIDTPTLTGHAPHVGYILVHGPELRLRQSLETLAGTNGYPPVNGLVFIENHLRPGALGSAKENAQRLAAEGVNTGVMIDLYHYLSAYDHRQSFAEQWKYTLQAVDTTFSELTNVSPAIRIGIHVPVGTRTEDSLPFADMPPPMWQDLAAIVRTRPDAILIIENQQSGGDTLKLTRSHAAEQRERNQMIYDRLGENGVL